MKVATIILPQISKTAMCKSVNVKGMLSYKILFISQSSAVSTHTKLQAGQSMVQIPKSYRMALGPTQLPIQWIPGFFPESKEAGALC
jgi:hypothetical protein